MNNQVSTMSPISSEKLNAMQSTKIDRWPLLKRFNNLKLEGQKWYGAWRDLSLYLNPTRGFFFNAVPSSGYKIDHSVVIDGYAARCIRDLASGMISGLTSPSRPWFKLEIEDPDLMEYDPVKRYFDECQLRMHSVLAKSNIYECLHMIYQELATFGTSAMFLMEDYEDVIRGRVFTIGEYFLGQGPENRVNTFARQYWMTVAQMVKEFGLENCSPSVRNDFAVHNTERWVRIIHLIEPNDERIPEYSDFRNMEYRSVYFEDNSMQNTYLQVGGFEEFPVMAARWELTTTADTYGRCPGWHVLGDDKMLQKEQREKLLILAKVGNPPVQVDASVQNVNTLPGGVTRSSSVLPNAGVRPTYQVAPNISEIREDILEIKKAMDDWYHRDLFRMLLNEASRPANVTATEIAEKQSERLSMISPVVTKFGNEHLKPMLSREYNIMNKFGLLPPPPKEISGMEIRVQYVSILAQAQRMIGITALEQDINFGMAMAKGTGDVSVLDNYNLDEIAQEHSKAIGNPAKTRNAPDVVVAKRKARADAQAKAANAVAMSQMAAGAKDAGAAAKDLSQAPLGTNSALDKLLSGIKGSA
jgi:hypothetical protein